MFAVVCFWCNLLMRFCDGSIKASVKAVMNRLFSNAAKSFLSMNGRNLGKVAFEKTGICVKGVTILQGIEFPIFLLIFEWALQQCSACSALALPVMFSLFRLVVFSVLHGFCESVSVCLFLVHVFLCSCLSSYGPSCPIQMKE